jgi:LDH2 family malate/lactate/ureidoglycolate dehydrogenase
VPHAELIGFVSLVFQRLGQPEKDSDTAARVLVSADLRGVESHGVVRLSPHGWYVKAFREGQINPKPNIRVLQETPASALLDGDGGMGMVVGLRAIELAIKKARGAGVGMVAVHNSRHFGMSGYYSMLALEHDMIGIAMTNASRQVVPTFGREAKYGTNPISLAAPAGEELPFVLDMATTTAAAGKLEIAARLGENIPLSWALDREAIPTSDPRIAQQARKLLPLGGSRESGSHKGYGLAIMIEILSGILTGSLVVGVGGSPALRGHLFVAINVASLRPVEDFKRDMDRLLRELKSTPAAAGQDRVYVAGEIEYEMARERTANGIPLLPTTVGGLRELGQQLDIHPPWLEGR